MPFFLFHQVGIGWLPGMRPGASGVPLLRQPGCAGPFAPWRSFAKKSHPEGWLFKKYSEFRLSVNYQLVAVWFSVNMQIHEINTVAEIPFIGINFYLMGSTFFPSFFHLCNHSA
jgi:hypothetical protein